MGQELHRLQETPQEGIFLASRQDQEVNERHDSYADPYPREPFSHLVKLLNHGLLSIHLSDNILYDHRVFLLFGRVFDRYLDLVVIDVGRHDLGVLKLKLNSHFPVCSRDKLPRESQVIRVGLRRGYQNNRYEVVLINCRVNCLLKLSLP